MTKLSKKQIDPKQMGYYINDLWSAFTLVDSKEDIKLLFQDLFTHTEYKMFAKRLQIARLLIEGEDYESIREKLRVTDVTTAHISNILATEGDGFRKSHEKLKSLNRKMQAQKNEQQANLENPLRKRLNQKTFGQVLLVEGTKLAVKAFKRKRKILSAEN